MIGILSSEWLRTKRTAIRWLTFCMPVIFAICALAYLGAQSMGTQQSAFEGFFTLWTVFVIPIGVSILAGEIVHEEELAGGFNSFLGTSLPRSRLYLGKFLLLLLCLTACTFTAVFTLCAGIDTVLHARSDISLFIVAAALTVIGTLPLLALHLWVSFAWGMGASVCFGIVGLLISALLGLTSLGSKIWPFIPWTWPVKLGMLPGALYLKEAKAVPAAKILSGMKLTAAAGLTASVIGLIVFLIGGIIWFNIWEGRKNSE